MPRLPVRPPGPSERSVVIAHRGASVAAPENTVEAFRLAGAMGADAVELDVHRTADGGLAVVHDEVLPDGRRVGAVALADRPAFVPTLAEALAACRGMAVNVEIKVDPRSPDFDPTLEVVDLVAAELGRTGWCDRVVVSSFHLPAVDRLLAIDPSVVTAWLVSEVGDRTLARLLEHGHRVLHPWDGAVTPEVMAACTAAGVGVNVWTVDDPARMVALQAMGVAGICTNVPDVALAALAG